jgi:integrase
MKSPAAKEKYVRRVARFFEFLGLQGTIQEQCRAFADKGRKDPNWAFVRIVQYLQFHRDRVERKEITAATMRNHVKSIKLFCEMADVDIPWKKVTRGLPRSKRFADDRAPTIDEIRRIIEYPDRRIKPIVLLMASTGIRVGAWDYLRWKDVKPIERGGRVVAAKVTVYSGDEDKYYTYATPEAYEAARSWMEYRTQCGETITGASWVMRNLWDVTTPIGSGLVTAPQKLKAAGIKRLMERALWAQGLRKKLEQGQKRHEFQADHGLRKWFKTRCEIAGMRSINIEELMSHSTGVSDSYYRATQEEILQDYLKAVDALTITNEHHLRNEVAAAEAKLQDERAFKEKLEDRDKQIDRLLRKQEEFEALVQTLIDNGSLTPSSRQSPAVP